MSETQTFVGYTPYPHQRAVHNLMKSAYKSGNIYVVKAKRQVGKTCMAENILLEFAINRNGTLSCLVEPTLDQSRRVYKDIIRAIQGTPILRRKNDSLLEIEFVNGSQILFKSAEQRDNLRGFTITGILVIDECAFIQNDIYDILQPTTDVHSAPILMISTPKLKQGFYYRYYTAGIEGLNPHIISIDFNDYDTSFMLSAEKLEQYRQMMPKAQFTTEYLGQFLDTDSILFNNIKGCVGVPDRTWNYLYVGIDWGTGGGGDYTSMSLFNDKGQMVDIYYFNDKSTIEQVHYIARILQEHKGEIRKIYAESNSIGTPMIELLKSTLESVGENDLSRRIEPFVTTNSEKIRLVNQLQVALEQNQILLKNDNGLIGQLQAYEATYNPKTNNVTYNAPQGLHDDNVISCMLGFDAYKSSQRYGQYSISIK